MKIVHWNLIFSAALAEFLVISSYRPSISDIDHAIQEGAGSCDRILIEWTSKSV